MGRTWLLPLYDPFTRLAGAGKVHRRLLDQAAPRPGQRILEIGCGTGNLLAALGRRDVEAVGIDPDRGALARARRKARGLPIRYERAYAGNLPLPDDDFDRVLSSLMLHHLPDGERLSALREARRVLRPGGELHIADLDGTHAGLLARRNRHVATSAPDRVAAELAEAGFTEVAETGRLHVRFGDVAFHKAK